MLNQYNFPFRINAIELIYIFGSNGFNKDVFISFVDDRGFCGDNKALIRSKFQRCIVLPLKGRKREYVIVKILIFQNVAVNLKKKVYEQFCL